MGWGGGHLRPQKKPAPKHGPLWGSAHISPTAISIGERAAHAQGTRGVVFHSTLSPILVGPHRTKRAFPGTAMSPSLQFLPHWPGPRDDFLLVCRFLSQRPSARESNLQQMVPEELREPLKQDSGSSPATRWLTMRTLWLVA